MNNKLIVFIYPSREGISTEFDLAINVGKHGRQATIKNALSSSEQFGLTKSDAMEIADKVNDVLSDWRTVFEDQGVCEKDIAIFENTFSQLIPGTQQGYSPQFDQEPFYLR